MRQTLLIGLLSASASFAQQGVWTGYVGGWQSTPAPVAVHPLALTYQTPAYRQLEFISRNATGYGYGYAPGYFPLQDSDQQEAMAAQAAQFAAQQEADARQRQYEHEQAMAAQAQLVAQQQQL